MADDRQADIVQQPPKCPRCKGHNVAYYEVVEAVVCFDRIVLVDGVIRPLDDGIDDASQPLSIRGRLQCEQCKHDWSCRYVFDDTVLNLRDFPPD